MKNILKYFDTLDDKKIMQFSSLEQLYVDWNAKINVISRKDIGELYIKHVLHSLAIAKVQQFKPNSKILDIGTGGGFPGIPLAILFPETQFLLVDSIGKKIKLVNEVTKSLQLKNVTAINTRAEKITDSFDFIVSRAVTNMNDFVKLTKNKIAKKSNHELKNGILYLKGGDLTEELQKFNRAKIFSISDFFEEEFFKTKKVVYLSDGAM